MAGPSASMRPSAAPSRALVEMLIERAPEPPCTPGSFG